MLPTESPPPKSRFKLVVVTAAVLIVVLAIVLGISWFGGQTTKTILPAKGAGQPIILNEYGGGNVAVHLPEFPVTIFMLGKPEPVAVETFGYAPRVKVQCDSMSGYQAMERGTMTSILGLWLTPVGLARVADKSGFESFAKEVASDSAPGGTPITIEDTEAPATGILSYQGWARGEGQRRHVLCKVRQGRSCHVVRCRR